MGAQDHPGRRIERGVTRGTLILHDINGEALEVRRAQRLGASGIVFGEVPPPVAALVHPHVFNQEAIAQAGFTGDADLAFCALLNDPLVGSGPDAREMFDEISETQREYLPQS